MSEQRDIAATDAIWWSLVSMTTVGYIDRSPVTQRGCVVAVLLMLICIALFSVLTSHPSSGFLASIVLGLTLVEKEGALPGEATILLVMTAIVLLSVFAYGASAVPLTRVYSRRAETMAETAPEMRDVVEMRTRLGAVRKAAKPIRVAPEQ